jgi:tetratricopeptide (TPR) repeat protein
MQWLRRLVTGKGASPPSQPRMVAPALADSCAGVESRLREMAERLDAGTVARVLDAEMEALIAGGGGEGVAHLVARVDSELLESEGPPADSLARIGSLYHRLALAPGGGAAQLRRALTLYERAMAQYDSAGDAERSGVVRNNMGLIHLDLGATDPASRRAAIVLLEGALEAFESDGDTQLERRGAVCVALGDAYRNLDEAGVDHLELAREYYERARAAFERSALADDETWAQERLGEIHGALAAFQGDDSLERSTRHYSNALAAHRAGNNQRGEARCLQRLADLLAARSADDAGGVAAQIEARCAALSALQLTEDNGGMILAHIALGRLRLRSAELGAQEALIAAADSFLTALRLLDEHGGAAGDDTDRAAALSGLARLYMFHGAASDLADLRQAIALLEEAATIYDAASSTQAYQKVQERLRQARASMGPPAAP